MIFSNMSILPGHLNTRITMKHVIYRRPYRLLFQIDNGSPERNCARIGSTEPICVEPSEDNQPLINYTLSANTR